MKILQSCTLVRPPISASNPTHSRGKPRPIHKKLNFDPLSRRIHHFQERPLCHHCTPHVFLDHVDNNFRRSAVYSHWMQVLLRRITVVNKFETVSFGRRDSYPSLQLISSHLWKIGRSSRFVRSLAGIPPSPSLQLIPIHSWEMSRLSRPAEKRLLYFIHNNLTIFPPFQR